MKKRKIELGRKLSLGKSVVSALTPLNGQYILGGGDPAGSQGCESVLICPGDSGNIHCPQAPESMVCDTHGDLSAKLGEQCNIMGIPTKISCVAGPGCAVKPKA